jgi:hypothetical protein
MPSGPLFSARIAVPRVGIFHASKTIRHAIGEPAPHGYRENYRCLRAAFHRFCGDLKPVRWGPPAGLLYPGMQLNPFEIRKYSHLKDAATAVLNASKRRNKYINNTNSALI